MTSWHLMGRRGNPGGVQRRAPLGERRGASRRRVPVQRARAGRRQRDRLHAQRGEVAAPLATSTAVEQDRKRAALAIQLGYPIRLRIADGVVARSGPAHGGVEIPDGEAALALTAAPRPAANLLSRARVDLSSNSRQARRQVEELPFQARHRRLSPPSGTKRSIGSNYQSRIPG